MKFIVATALAFFLFACSAAGQDPHLKAARGFLDAYYVFASQEQALLLTTSFASEQIKKELELLKEVARQDAYRSRDVLFDLKKELQSDDQVIYLFELTIKVPELPDQTKMVNITVDKNKKLVKYFGTVR